MGFNGALAQQQFCEAHVRFGSKADIGTCPDHVRFTPKSGHWLIRVEMFPLNNDANSYCQLNLRK
jgi:hypothetical protein